MIRQNNSLEFIADALDFLVDTLPNTGGREVLIRLTDRSQSLADDLNGLHAYLKNRLDTLDAERATLDAALAQPLTLPLGTIEKMRELDAAAREVRAILNRWQESVQNCANP